MSDDDVQMDVKKATAVVVLNVDDDGTPMYLGERLIEVRPGHWMHPDAVALERFLEARL